MAPATIGYQSDAVPRYVWAWTKGGPLIRLMVVGPVNLSAIPRSTLGTKGGLSAFSRARSPGSLWKSPWKIVAWCAQCSDCPNAWPGRTDERVLHGSPCRPPVLLRPSALWCIRGCMFETLVNIVPRWKLPGQMLWQGVRAPLGELTCNQCSNSTASDAPPMCVSVCVCV